MMPSVSSGLPTGTTGLACTLRTLRICARSQHPRPRSVERATSVYFPERAVHMFPSELATGLCSLNPRVDRLVQSCLMEIDRNGQVVRYELYDAIIKTAERMTYTDVNAIITDRNPAVMQRYEGLVPMFELMRELFEVLNGRRRRRGSIDFDLSESEVILDQAGLVEAIIASERNVAHRLTEEFMLLANETVAAYLEQSLAPAIYRVHEDPDLLKVEQFEEFVASLGYSLAAPLNAVRPVTSAVWIAIRNARKRNHVFSCCEMQKARYAAENPGLWTGGNCYTNFTIAIGGIRTCPCSCSCREAKERRRRIRAGG